MASLNPKLRSFWQDDSGALRQARVRCLYGGRSSSKSWEFCGRLTQIGQEYKTRALCVRRFQNNIKDSVFSLIKNQIDNFEFSGYTKLATSITHSNGSEFVFYGIERNIDEIKSFEGAHILYIEEAHNLTKSQWDILEPTIRSQNSEIWISFNPRLITDFVWKRFVANPPPNSIVKLINYTDNEFISDTMLEVIENKKAEDFEDYEHIYLGIPKSDDNGAIIKMSWIQAAIDADKVLGIDFTGSKTIGYDVADSGDDANALVGMDGSKCVFVDEWKAQEDELVRSAKRARASAIELDADIVYDCIGVGANVGSNLNELGFKNHLKFNAGGKVVNPKRKYKGIKQGIFFSNIKAQAWWLVADRFRNTYNAIHKGEIFTTDEMISIDSELPNIEKLMTELSCVKRDFDNRGMVKVESKKDLAKREIESPNLADAVIMAASKGLIKSGKLSASAW